MKTKFVILFCLFTNLLFAQIGFEHITKNNTWDVILAKAKAENKLIFVDAYAVWCGPCKFMERNIFTHPEVGQYYNDNFINVSVDMETSQGRKFDKLFPVTAYPTLLYINTDGKILKKKVGSISKPQQFIDVAKWTVNPELDPLIISTKKYKEGARDKESLIEHIGNLFDNDSSATDEIQAYLTNVKPLTLTDKGTFSIFYIGVNDLRNDLTKDFITKLDHFSEKYGGQAVSSKVKRIINHNTQLAIDQKDKKRLSEVIDFINIAFAGEEDVENRQELIKEINHHYKKSIKKSAKKRK